MQVACALLIDEIRKHPDGRVDLLGLFEDIYLDSVPVTLESLSVFLDLEVAPEDKGKEHSLELSVTDPDGMVSGEVTRVRFGIPPAEEFPRESAQLDLALFEVPFHRFGPHAVEIRTGGRLLRRLPLFVHPAQTALNETTEEMAA
jgi:hypothetical protein